MFKINKLEQVNQEKVSINYVDWEVHKYNQKEIEEFKTLSFDIEGILDNNTYSISFYLKCRTEELLKIPSCETIDFKEYIDKNNIYFIENNITDLEPEIKITANRWIKNKFIINIYFCSSDNNHSGVIEFGFNLDDYL